MAHETPSLAASARPYYDIINDIVKGAYEFKNTVRSDYLKDAYVPAKEIGAQQEYAQNRYNLEEFNQNAPYNMGSSGLNAQSGYSAAQNGYALQPAKNQADAYGVQANVYDNQLQVEEGASSLLTKQARDQLAQQVSVAPGATPLDRFGYVYGRVSGDNRASPQLKQEAMNAYTAMAQQVIATSEPNSAEYKSAMNVLRRFGLYGVASPTGSGAAGGWTP